MKSTDTRLHVLHVIGTLQLGGAETLLFRLAKANDRDVRHEVICLGDRGWYSDQIEGNGVTVHHLGMVSAGSFIRGIPGFARLVRRLRPDVIQSWMYLSNVMAGVFGPNRRHPGRLGNPWLDPRASRSAIVAMCLCRWLGCAVADRPGH